MVYNNPNTIKSYKILQKLSPKHAAHGVAQSTYPNYRHGKACLSKQPPWRAAGDPRLARGRSRVRAPGPAGALRVLFFSTLPSFFSHLPHQPRKSVREYDSCLWKGIHRGDTSLCVYFSTLSSEVGKKLFQLFCVTDGMLHIKMLTQGWWYNFLWTFFQNIYII